MPTFGSTGNLKSVELTHGNLVASMAGRVEGQQLTSDDTNWIAFDHVAALLESHMITTYVGADQLPAEPAVVLEVAEIFAEILGIVSAPEDLTWQPAKT